ncbi:ribulose-1,5 bisphosphate carboxylase/oxygenase large subunit N-methyltransferase, chloroplastic isoform X1 [Dioscorea cayenensis subsp. rotundata]|uniref:Ribulose-1,5 bisphosphate carboxylase/oxygenase large subunit N-methyltransferase, chloroplastic isoform X1 n=1 Tax=Dioscorea cayennensis subsp. rotundata TaxID=55577 RepID=A0AB40CB58_DIOCR|nr:ribulose-1,5 bisphosphate carboxylase/oxygenase large subunit N-methyltransferase, chloroplastic isoform X1 [Dioscorea cayenensis subsp. rotundata]XP_039136349.1 ribulose-1,5 bisphosphate carboxylase/oxygenase large subunit N-methyltransferase, chloroplastic isoform X1 [Dioscorea cayenensis subsp. rotundata]XP_039136350.1 ribulose-1,5 bisphosphate carboxylase/oxygenase large subunit N-methyltransferase, chloroplastic isoform X1 [Dioscorea cayenensis subsp. rotundata]
MIVGGRIPRFLPFRPSSSLLLLRRREFCSVASSESSGECDVFLPWLQRKAGSEISSTLFIGFSKFGRSLFASKSIRAGDCILRVPFNVQITQENLLPEIESHLVSDVSSISRVALVLLAEKKLGQDSEWAPYITSLPSIHEMHSTIFWSEEEVEMLHKSRVYRETMDKKAFIENEFSSIRPALLSCVPQIYGDCKLVDFMHAYSLVESRAWRTSLGVSLVPFADYLNHDGVSEAVLLSDDDKEISEVIADRDYAACEQVLIRYGKFSNATLLLDFGFTLPCNIYDQVQICMDVPLGDPLYKVKSELWKKYSLPTVNNAPGFSSSGNFFTLKKVKTGSKKGKGIPQALRALSRVLSATSNEELKAMETEAAENDGRLARRTLKDMSKEILAHHILLAQLERAVHSHVAAITALSSAQTYNDHSRFTYRRQMARDVLEGELCVLRSACDWIKNYCLRLLE